MTTKVILILLMMKTIGKRTIMKFFLSGKVFLDLSTFVKMVVKRTNTTGTKFLLLNSRRFHKDLFLTTKENLLRKKWKNYWITQKVSISFSSWTMENNFIWRIPTKRWRREMIWDFYLLLLQRRKHQRRRQILFKWWYTVFKKLFFFSPIYTFKSKVERE